MGIALICNRKINVHDRTLLMRSTLNFNIPTRRPPARKPGAFDLLKIGSFKFPCLSSDLSLCQMLLKKPIVVSFCHHSLKALILKDFLLFIHALKILHNF